MNTFKAGDKVRRIHADFSLKHRIGDIAEVVEASTDAWMTIKVKSSDVPLVVMTEYYERVGVTKPIKPVPVELVREDRMKFHVYTHNDVDYYVSEELSEEFVEALGQGRTMKAQTMCSLIICDGNQISKCRYESISWFIAQRPKIKRFAATEGLSFKRVK